MSGFRVPKLTTQVDVTLIDRSSHRVKIFLAETAETHAGPERLQEWLAGPVRFLPAIDEQSGRVLWFNRDTIRTVRASASVDLDRVVESTIPTEQEIAVHLRDGDVVTGLVAYVLPDSQSRLTDFLNEPHPFVRLVEGPDVLFINKHHILRVTTSEA